MSPTHWLISAFIVFHLLSIVVGSTPDPATLKSQVAPDREVLTSAGRLIAPVLDATVEPIRTLDKAVWNATGWCRPAVRKYLGTTKQYQRWNMFSRPMRRHEYIHLRYYIASPQTNLLRVQRELISPGHTGGNVRLFKSFADSFRDKAISLAYDAYSRRLQREGKKQSAAIARERSQVELIPVMRPFVERRRSQLLGPGERLVRVELWRGHAPMPRPGQLLPFDTYERRQEVLAGYDAISDLDLIAPSELAPLGARMEDADIEWGLLSRIIWK